MIDFELKEKTSRAWLDTVLADFDAFLADHASCEKKASGMAMSMIAHYPDKPRLCPGWQRWISTSLADLCWRSRSQKTTTA